MKNQRGITLISLVITIVILIILAGVAINMSLGENGIFKKAQEAKKMQTIATAKEQIGLEILEAQIEAIENNDELEQSELEAIVSKYGTLQADGDTIVLNDGGYEVSLREIYNEMAEAETDGDSTTELAQLKALLSQTTVTEDKILKDYKAYKDGQLITGTMENYAGQTLTATTITESGENAEITIPQAGYYDTTSKISVPVNVINSNLKSFDQFITWYDGVKGWVTSDDGSFTITDNGDWLQFDSSKKIHFVACNKKQTKTINFSVSDYNTCIIEVSNDNSSWTQVYKKILSTNASWGNYGRTDSFTIPEAYNDYTYIRIRSSWDSAYQLWYTATVDII